MANIEENTQRYKDWVNEQYPSTRSALTPNTFIPPDLNDGKILDTLGRFLLYGESSVNAILNGGTGPGKTVLMKYVSHESGKPLFAIPPVKDLRANQVIGMYIDRPNESFFEPGPLLRFLCSDRAYLAFDEMPNINASAMIPLHNALQYEPIEVYTHMGLIYLAPQPGKHHFVGAGNFDYQKTTMTRATLQRSAFMDMPYLEGELFKSEVTASQPAGAKTMQQYTDLLARLYPWKSEGYVHPTKVDQRWMNTVDKADKKRDSLVKMCSELRDMARKYDQFGHMPLEISNAAIKRVVSLYSPFLDSQSFTDIVIENMFNPLTVQYPGMQKEKGDLLDSARSIVKRYSRELLKG